MREIGNTIKRDLSLSLPRADQIRVSLGPQEAARLDFRCGFLFTMVIEVWNGMRAVKCPRLGKPTTLETQIIENTADSFHVKLKSEKQIYITTLLQKYNCDFILN